jgi:exosome complex exonuclease DIS3/RRP44
VFLCQSQLTFAFFVSSLIMLISGFSRLGIEGLVMFKRDTQFNAENYTITVPSSSSSMDQMKTIAVFDKVKVRIEVEKDKNTQRGRVKMTLIHPIDSRDL